ncbi:hypothetical protein ALC53_05682 [Atta colombica]|uniref:DNAation factor subunit beta n=1 Tax=Atta colombica TaxID=520822 RepID=A0A151I3U3_9HYME|nr:hypothetical protein ALC53_05682 [Atta colombica]
MSSFESNKRHLRIMFDHMLAPVKTYLETLKWEVLPHPPYSSDIAPSDYHLFRSMTHGLSEQHFTSYEDTKNCIDDWSLYNLLLLHLHKIFNDTISEAPSYIRNNYDLVIKLFSLWSHMVVSLFINVPIELASDSVVRRVNSTFFFIFKSTLYKQIFETSIGSLLSPIVTDMILQNLEEIAIGRLPYRLLFYFRYVNDIILAAPSESVDDILGIFNSLNTKLQFTVEVFTVEVDMNNRISFLDSFLLIIKEEKLDIPKATFSSRFLNFNSHHPVCHKRGVIYGFIDRIVRFCHPRFQKNNLMNVINILLKNEYPLQFIFSTLYNRIKFHNKITTTNIIKVKEKFFAVPSNLSLKNFHLANMFNCKLAYTIPNTLKDLIRKDWLKGSAFILIKMLSTRFYCDDCDVSYVSQIKIGRSSFSVPLKSASGRPQPLALSNQPGQGQEVTNDPTEVNVFLLDGSLIDEEYFHTLEPQTTLILQKPGEKVLSDADILYEALRRVNIDFLTAGDRVTQFLTENLKGKVALLNKVLNKDDSKTALSTREEHPEWFENLETNCMTKEAYMHRRCQDRIRTYLYKTIEQIKCSDVFMNDYKARQQLLHTIAFFKLQLKQDHYFGYYFDRSRADCFYRVKLREKQIAICNKKGEFKCEGRWNTDGCPYGDRHKINPYKSKEDLVLFSTWNLDHKIERSRTLIPKLLQISRQDTINEEDIYDCYDNLFTVKNLRLVHIVCHDKGSHK